MSQSSENKTYKERIVRHFADEILSGRLKPGDKLPSEREIAEKMQVSRSVVHLAMEQLSSMELIDMQPRVGNFVPDFRRSGNFVTMMALAGYSDDSNQQEMIYALVELRNAIEGGALRLLARTGTAEDFSCLRKLNAQFMEKVAEGVDIPSLVPFMRAFHYEIVYRSRNCFYSMIMNSFGNISRPWELCLSFWTPEGIGHQNEHVISLLEQGKGEDAAQYIVEIYNKYKEANPLPC